MKKTIIQLIAINIVTAEKLITELNFIALMQLTSNFQDFQNRQ